MMDLTAARRRRAQARMALAKARMALAKARFTHACLRILCRDLDARAVATGALHVLTLHVPHWCALMRPNVGD